MKSRSLLILALIISLALLPSLQLALAAQNSSSSSSSTSSTSSAPKTPYSERVDIYTAGANDYWMVTLSPVNATRSGIVAAESVSGVSAYEVTAVQGSTASAGSPLFYKTGYNVAHLPFLPFSGVFLNVTASSSSAAQTAASDFSSVLGTNFTQISSSGGNYTFYSPADFGIAGAALFATAPRGNGGLASAVTETSLASDPTPTAILTGVKNGSSFDHSLSFGSTEPSGVGTNQSLLLENAMNLPNASYVSSSRATSSMMVVHSLDGLIKSKDNATVIDNVANFTSTYSFNIQPGARFKPNMTITQNPPVLVATRSVDTGSLTSGGVVSVTLSFRNNAYNGTIQNVVVNDSWWKAYPTLFSLSVGNSSFTIPSLAPQQNVSRAYVLKVTGSDSQDLTAPAAKVSYQYTGGNLMVNSSTFTNEVEVRTNNPGPSLEINAVSDIYSGSSLGKAGNFAVTVTNTGSNPALNLNVLNYTDPTLVAGGVWTFKVPLPLTSLSERNLTETFTLGWTTPGGTTGKLLSNPAVIVLSHSTLQLPAVEFKLTASPTAKALAQGTLNATYTLTNKGAVVGNNVTIVQAFPSGVTCSNVSSGNGTCGASGFSLTVPTLATFVNETGTLVLKFSNDNYIVPGATVDASQGPLRLQTLGSSLPIAAGVSVVKTFSPSAVFVGETSNVSMEVSNKGSQSLYNVTVSTVADSFDSAVAGALNKEYPTLAQGASDSLNYTAKMTAAGNHTSASTSLSYIFGGYRVQYAVSSGVVLVYKPVVATTTALSSPREGADFSLGVSVQNQSPENVNDVTVTFKLPVGLTVVSHPSGVQISGRTVTLTVPSLAAGTTSNNSVTLKADFDGSFSLTSGNVTFTYLGATIPGLVSNQPISVGVDALLRYELPIGAAVVLTLLVAVYIHRKPVAQAK